MKRNTAQTIFRTVVVAGAMLGAPACKKNAPSTTPPPSNLSTPADPAMATPTTEATQPTPAADPCADPCGGGERPRGVDDDGGGGAGRGFILS